MHSATNRVNIGKLLAQVRNPETQPKSQLPALVINYN